MFLFNAAGGESLSSPAVAEAAPFQGDTKSRFYRLHVPLFPLYQHGPSAQPLRHDARGSRACERVLNHVAGVCGDGYHPF